MSIVLGLVNAHEGSIAIAQTTRHHDMVTTLAGEGWFNKSKIFVIITGNNIRSFVRDTLLTIIF